jgi:two-component system sensor histidine kinase DesK
MTIESAPKRPTARAFAWAIPDNKGVPGDGPRRWRRGGGLWLLYLLSPLGDAWSHHRLSASIGGTVLLLAFSACYLFVVPLGWWGRGEARYGWQITVLLFSLGAGATAVIGYTGVNTMIFVAVGMVMLLPIRVAAAGAVVLAVTTSVLPEHIHSWHLQGVQWGQGAAVLLAGLAVYGFSRLIRANHELAAARSQVAVLAAAQERARIARDMHDVLGHSLTTLTVKAALAGRLVEADPSRARAEIADVERLAREALSDVRATLAGVRDVRLATELVNARQVLEAAGIQAELPGVVDNVEGDLAPLFGWVLREGVTNVVRHSRAGRVVVTVEPRAIEIVDDGPGCLEQQGKSVDRTSGHGLAGLAERASSAGGRMLAGPVPAGSGFRLRVEVPS